MSPVARVVVAIAVSFAVTVAALRMLARERR